MFQYSLLFSLKEFLITIFNLSLLLVHFNATFQPCYRSKITLSNMKTAEKRITNAMNF